MHANAILPAALARPRLLVGLGLGVLTVLAWVYTVWLALRMPMPAMTGAMGGAGLQAGMGMALPMTEPWSLAQAAFMLAMWTVMMVAMMVPAAAPMILIFHRVAGDRAARGQAAVPTGFFLGGYLLVWTGFSALATAAQWALHDAALLSPGMAAASPLLGGALLVAAGVFQLTPLKHACLARCRSPLAFLLNDWREGHGGALAMGLRHGAFCTGCCWALMALLFVGGVMNLLWVAGLAGVVLGEKVLPRGHLLGRLGGAALIGWGGWMLLAVPA
jgi:predicted metal-binding membrane protein